MLSIKIITKKQPLIIKHNPLFIIPYCNHNNLYKNVQYHDIIIPSLQVLKTISINTFCESNNL